MHRTTTMRTLRALLTLLALGGVPLSADIIVQCPGDINGDGVSDTPGVVCKHLASSDGYIMMADGKALYMFGFSDVTGLPANQVMAAGLLGSQFPAPLLAFDEGDQVYLNLSNTSFAKRPDLFDPHTVHFHGFPQTGTIFDGLPESAIAINVGSTATYYYKLVEAGTYMYHCHAEATEHMQMGMLGQLYVRPKQNKLPAGTTFPNGFVHQAGYKYAYNDNDGSTRYDVEIALQMTGLDSNFHDEHEAVQPLPFALMKDTYGMLNGRGYPDTVNANPLAPPTRDGQPLNGGRVSQQQTALVQARAGQKILVRLSNLNVTRAYTLMSLGVPMQVVGRDAKIYRGPTGSSLAYKTNSIHLGSGETADVLLDTTGIGPGTYFLYTAELNYLSNYGEDYGGMMTEVRLAP